MRHILNFRRSIGCFLFLINCTLLPFEQKKIYLIHCIGDDKPFDPIEPHFTMDRILPSLQALKKAFVQLGYDLQRSDLTDSLHDAEYIICFDVPWNYFERGNLPSYPPEKLVVFLWEPPTVKPFNYREKNHKEFSKVFTWNDDLVDNKTYYKFYYPYPWLYMVDETPFFEEKKLCTLIAFNKDSKHAHELYSKRKDMIEFFEQLQADDFDLYGRGWRLCGYNHYKGAVTDKIKVLKNYKFCICYENMTNIQGYVTEKIFDCFHAGCVPIYWGADNIEAYVPKECFIDRRDFENEAALYVFLKQMNKDTYEQYQEHIRRYLQSDDAFLFSTACFIDVVIGGLIPDYDSSLIFSCDEQQKLARVRHHYR